MKIPSLGGLTLFLALNFISAWAQQPAAPNLISLKIGDQAPDFSLPDQDGKIVQLSSFLGKQKVVLAFYVKAFTGG